MLLTSKKLIYLIVAFFCFSTYIQGQSTSLNSEDELIAKANSLFEIKNFEEAKPLFSQLLSLYPKDPEYNYKYGTCLLIAGNDREEALEYVQYAIGKGDVEDKAYFYLGKAFHMNYEFEKAIQAFKKYKERSSSSQQKEMQVDRYIQMCVNGKSLLKKFKGVKVLQKQDMSQENFYRIYQMEGLKGQLLAKPEKFMSKEDKKLNESSVMFFPENATELYFSGYGDKAENGKDIFKVILLGNGKWSDPINLGNVINTAFDEDYVFVHPKTQMMYFASNGHNSMGGFDLFKSSYDPEIANWTQVENLDFPYSTVDNDYMYVEVPGNPTAFFASDRFRTAGKTSVYKVNTIEVEPNIAVIKGKLSIEGMPEIQKATITVKDEAGNLVSKVETNRDSYYEIAFDESGGSYVFNVETEEDSPIHSGKIVLPPNEGTNVYSQELVLKGDKANQTLVIKNDFEAREVEVEEISLSAELIKKQAELKVNATEESLANNSSIVGTSAENEGQIDPSDSSPLKTTRSKEEINKDILGIKKENQLQLERTMALAGTAYDKAKTNSDKANELYLLVDQQTGTERESTLRRANENAAKAIAFMEIASGLEKEIDKLEKNQELIASADADMAELLLDDKLDEANNKIRELHNSLQTIDQIAEGNKIPDTVLQNVNASKSNLVSLQSKLEELQKDKEQINEDIASLELESKNASSKRKEEIQVSIKNYELDLKDLDFRTELLEEKTSQANTAFVENSLLAEGWKEISQEPTAMSAANYTQEEKSAIENDVLTLNQNHNVREYPYEMASASSNTPEEDRFAEELGNESSQPEQVVTSAVNQDRVEAVKENQTTTSIDGADESKLEVSEELNRKTARVADLDTEEKEIYSLPAAKELVAEALDIKQQSDIKYKEYNELLISLRSLPTEGERTAAFERAHKLQEEARFLEIKSATVRANANKIQYLRNNAHIRSLTDSPIPSANTNLVLLLADEAAIYYEQAHVLRAELDSSDRFSKKESNLIEALEYEKKALLKQEQALQLMDSNERILAEKKESRVEPKVAKAEAESLQKEYASLNRLANDLRKDAEKEQNTVRKDSLLALADENDSIAGKKLIQANILYVQSQDTEGFSVSNEYSKAVSIGTVSKPDVVDSTALAQLDESSRKTIVSSPEFIEFNKIYEEKEELVGKTFVVYQNAKAKEKIRDSLVQKEAELRQAALESGSESEKVRLIQEAIVLNSNIESLNSSLDSASKIMKLRNYLIAKKEENIKQQLAEVQDKEKAGQMILMAKVVYAEKAAKEDEQAPELADSELLETEDNVQNADEVLETEAESDQEEILEIKEEDTEDVAVINVPEGKEQETAELPEVDDGSVDQVESQEEIVEEKIVETVESKDKTFVPRQVENDLFEIRNNVSNYTNTNPIPIDPVLPNGLVYQVQVGAFRNPIPQDHFQGFAPLMGVTAANGITRYTAGLFNDFPDADKAKDEIRKLGYSDAFVVAYMKGKRISVAEARNLQASILSSGNTVAENGFSTEVTNQAKSTREQSSAASSNAFETDAELIQATDSKTIDGVYFSIQVGVFSKPLKKGDFGYEGLLIVDRLPSGLYRYHIGIFDDLEAAKRAHQNNISNDIPDSFVVAYHNGNRIGLSQAAAIISNR